MSSSSSASAPSASASGSVSGSASGSSASGSRTSSISIPQTAAAGGITVLQPANTASPSYYKIASGEFITFQWNLTSLYVTPTHLTVVASCSANGNTYPVGPTASPANTLAGNATGVVWNPWQWEQSPNAIPFAEATYVLQIWDERGPGAAIRGGYLSPYAGTQFAMYRPEPYTSIAGASDVSLSTISVRLLLPRLTVEDIGEDGSGGERALTVDGWRCTTCSNAIEAIAEPAGIAVFTSVLISLFTAWNILRR